MKVHLISTPMDCKPRSSIVSKKAPIASKKLPLQIQEDTSGKDDDCTPHL